MSLGRSALGVAALLAALEGLAAAQEVGADRFFAEETADENPGETAVDGSFTSTTFYYTESGGDATPPSDVNEIAPFSASPVDRIFTDLRTQLDARHVGGSKVDVRVDARGRFDASSYSTFSRVQPGGEDDVPSQSGTFGGNELDLRELYLRRRGSSVDLSVGRQYTLELAATRFDGLKVEGKGQRWKLIAFGGLYPSRISRDVREDYPTGFVDDPAAPGVLAGDRVLPVVGGAGTAYRYQSAYGALGVVGILPLGDDNMNGYWRASPRVDVFHYVVADAAGADGAGLTNLTLGVNLQPTDSLRAYANVTRIDTETLNVVAQAKLDEPDSAPVTNPPSAQTTFQNNIEVQRTAQESARIGLSANFGERVELSTSGAVRRRGELSFETANGEQIVFEAAQAADITIALVDRHSIGDSRIGLSATRSFGVGNVNLNRTTATIARLDVTKSVRDGRGELEANVSYILSADDNRGGECGLATGPIAGCYGAAEAQSFGVGGLFYYRFHPSWFGLLSANLGPQLYKTTDSMGNLVDQPTILTVAALLRVAYRF
jgi:hypothetical protein